MEAKEKHIRHKNVMLNELVIGTYDIIVLKEVMGNFMKKRMKVEEKIKNAHKLDPKMCRIE